MTKEEFMILPLAAKAALLADKEQAKLIYPMFFTGQRGNGNNKRAAPSPRNIERQVTKAIGIRQVKRIAYKRFKNV